MLQSVCVCVYWDVWKVVTFYQKKIFFKKTNEGSVYLNIIKNINRLIFKDFSSAKSRTFDYAFKDFFLN